MSGIELGVSGDGKDTRRRCRFTWDQQIQRGWQNRAFATPGCTGKTQQLQEGAAISRCLIYNNVNIKYGLT